MAKKPVKPSSDARSTPGGPPAPASGTKPEATPTPPVRPNADELEGELMVSVDELDEIERRLNAGLASAEPATNPLLGDRRTAAEPAVESEVHTKPAKPTKPTKAEPPEAPEEVVVAPVKVQPAASAASADREKPSEGEAVESEVLAGAVPGVVAAKRSAGGGFGSSEWAALAGFGVLGVVAAVLFFKFLYGHPAPVQGPGLPKAFKVPMAGAVVHLVGAEAAWRPRAESDKARTEEVMLPSLSLTAGAAPSSKGFVRVEFLDPDGKIRGDVMTVEIEGGKFKDGGRGEVVEEGGTKVRLVGTVGFRSHPLFTSYLTSDETRWSVRLKEGADYSNGPWTELGAALIPNPQLSTQSNP